MAIQYVGGRGAGRAGSTSSVNVAINSGLTGGIGSAAIAGDLVIVTVAVGTQGRNPSCAVTSGGGWTNKTQQHTTATTYDISVQTSLKIMGSTPDTLVTIPSTGNIADGQGYTIHVYRGVDPTNPEDVAAAYAAATGTGRANPASILPVTAGAWIYVGAGAAAGTGTTAWTAAYLSSLLQYNGADTNDGRAGGGHLTWPGGTYDPAVFGGGSTTSTSSWGATTLALRPAPSGTPQELAGSVAATSAVAGALTVSRPLVGAVAATSAAEGDLQVIHPQLLAGVAPASSTVAGAASVGKLLGGSAAGQSAVAGAILKPASLAGSVPALATTSGTLSPAVAARLAGIIAAQAQAAGAAAVGKPLAGAAPAAAVMAGDLLCEKLLSGSVLALSGLAGAAQQDIHLAGLAAAEALVAGDLKVGAAAELEGIVAAASGVTGSLWVAHFLDGQASGQADQAGALEVLRHLRGLVGGIAALIGALSIGKPLNGQVAAASQLSGRLLETPPQILTGESPVIRMLFGESPIVRELAGESQVVRQLVGESEIEV